MMILDTSKIMYEDQLPELTDEEYDLWFKNSWVDGVRLGFRVVLNKKEIKEYIDNIIRLNQTEKEIKSEVFTSLIYNFKVIRS